MSDLLPCPFCGGENVSLSESGLWVMCDNCEGDGPTAASGLCKTPREGWNRRAPADPALLALARLGALMCRDADWPRSPDDPDQSPGYIDLSACELRRVMDDAGLLLGRDGTPEPGVRAAIAALLAPDGAGEVAP